MKKKKHKIPQLEALDDKMASQIRGKKFHYQIHVIKKKKSYN